MQDFGVVITTALGFRLPVDWRFGSLVAHPTRSAGLNARRASIEDEKDLYRTVVSINSPHPLHNIVIYGVLLLTFAKKRQFTYPVSELITDVICSADG